jgi:hypothetical protein
VDSLFRFLVKYELVTYAIIGLGAIFAIRSTWKAWGELHRSVFGLEKELSVQRLRISGATVILLLMIGLSQFCLVSFVVPFLPATAFLLTPTANLLQTPESTLDASAAATAAAGTPLPPPGTTGCVPGQLIITFPVPGQEISGKINLTGNVNVPNFGFYKYEFARQGNQDWTTIGAGNKLNPDNEPLNSWTLGAWDPTELVPGDYQLRLIVTDNLGKSPLSPCIIPVRIVAPTPTPQ